VTAEGEAILSEFKESQQEYQYFSRKSTKIRKDGKDSNNFKPLVTAVIVVLLAQITEVPCSNRNPGKKLAICRGKCLN